MSERGRRGLCASAALGSGPEFPAVAAPLIDLDGALEVSVLIARRRATSAGAPIDLVDLEDSNVIGPVGVIVRGLLVAIALVLYDALAAGLAPAVLRADCRDVDWVGGFATWTLWTLPTRAVATAAIGIYRCQHQGQY